MDTVHEIDALLYPLYHFHNQGDAPLAEFKKNFGRKDVPTFVDTVHEIDELLHPLYHFHNQGDAPLAERDFGRKDVPKETFDVPDTPNTPKQPTHYAELEITAFTELASHKECHSSVIYFDDFKHKSHAPALIEELRKHNVKNLSLIHI